MKNWSVLYGNSEVNNSIIWGHIDVKFGHIVCFHIKSWYRKNLSERVLDSKVMSSGAFVFVLESLFLKSSKICKLRGGSQVGNISIGL